MLGIPDRDADLIRGRKNIAEFLGIHPQTLDKHRKGPNPPPINRPFNDLEAYKSELIKWRKEQ
jgi:hypothetical protein